MKKTIVFLVLAAALAAMIGCASSGGSAGGAVQGSGEGYRNSVQKGGRDRYIVTVPSGVFTAYITKSAYGYYNFIIHLLDAKGNKIEFSRDRISRTVSAGTYIIEVDGSDGGGDYTLFITGLSAEQLAQAAQAAQQEEERQRLAAAQAAEQQRQQELSAPNSPDDFDFIQNAQGSITIRDYKGTRRNVNIPETISGIKVTEIATGAFRRKSILSVVIPDTVTTIGQSAFSGSSELSHVVLPNAITAIADSVFSGCESLQTITIPDSVTTIGDNAFEKCGLTSITFSSRLAAIGAYAFQNNQLTEVQFHPTLITINRGAFRNNRITSLTLPNGILLLGEESFGSNPLSSIVIPSSLAEFSSNPTEGFRGAFTTRTITSITLPSDVNERNLQGFDESFMNFWRLQNKRAGTYVNENRIWTVR